MAFNTSGLTIPLVRRCSQQCAQIFLSLPLATNVLSEADLGALHIHHSSWALTFLPASFLVQETLLHCSWPLRLFPPSWCSLLAFKLKQQFHAHACLPPTIFLVFLHIVMDDVLWTGCPERSAPLPARRVSHEILPTRSLKKCKPPLLKLKNTQEGTFKFWSTTAVSAIFFLQEPGDISLLMPEKTWAELQHSLN